MKVKHGAIIAIAVLALEASAARPIPRLALAARLAEVNRGDGPHLRCEF